MAKKLLLQYGIEIGNFVDLYHIVSCRLDQNIYYYDESEGIYKLIDSVELSKLASDYLENSGTQLEWCDYHMKMMMKYAKTKAPYFRRMGGVNALVLNNGTFYVKDMKLHEHSPKYKAIAKLNFDYNPNALCPVTEMFLRTMADGNENLYITLWEVIGYVAMRSLRARKAFVLSSPGGSGKSQYLRLLAEFASKEHTSYLSINSINSEKAFDRIDLLNSHLNITQELSKKEADLNTFFSANVKKAVTLEEIDAEQKFGKKIYFEPKFVMVVASNYIPTFSSMPSESILRRIVFINITKVLKYEEQDLDLFKKIKKELSGVFNKAIHYYEILKENNFVFAIEEESRAFVKAKINEQYPMYSFVTEMIEACPGHKVYYSELQNVYRRWAEERDIFVTLDSNSLSKELKNAIEEQNISVQPKKTNGNRCLVGIKIKNI